MNTLYDLLMTKVDNKPEGISSKKGQPKSLIMLLNVMIQELSPDLKHEDRAIEARASIAILQDMLDSGPYLSKRIKAYLEEKQTMEAPNIGVTGPLEIAVANPATSAAAISSANQPNLNNPPMPQAGPVPATSMSNSDNMPAMHVLLGNPTIGRPKGATGRKPPTRGTMAEATIPVSAAGAEAPIHVSAAGAEAPLAMPDVPEEPGSKPPIGTQAQTSVEHVVSHTEDPSVSAPVPANHLEAIIGNSAARNPQIDAKSVADSTDEDRKRQADIDGFLLKVEDILQAVEAKIKHRGQERLNAELMKASNHGHAPSPVGGSIVTEKSPDPSPPDFAISATNSGPLSIDNLHSDSVEKTSKPDLTKTREIATDSVSSLFSSMLGDGNQGLTSFSPIKQVEIFEQLPSEQQAIVIAGFAIKPVDLVGTDPANLTTAFKHQIENLQNGTFTHLAVSFSAKGQVQKIYLDIQELLKNTPNMFNSLFTQTHGANLTLTLCSTDVQPQIRAITDDPTTLAIMPSHKQGLSTNEIIKLAQAVTTLIAAASSQKPLQDTQAPSTPQIKAHEPALIGTTTTAVPNPIIAAPTPAAITEKYKRALSSEQQVKRKDERSKGKDKQQYAKIPAKKGDIIAKSIELFNKVFSETNSDGIKQMIDIMATINGIKGISDTDKTNKIQEEIKAIAIKRTTWLQTMWSHSHIIGKGRHPNVDIIYNAMKEGGSLRNCVKLLEEISEQKDTAEKKPAPISPTRV